LTYITIGYEVYSSENIINQEEVLFMIRIAIVGIGNCSSSLVQAVSMSRNVPLDSGVAFEKIGGYSVSDIYFSAAFDVDNRKIGKDLSQAILSAPNCTTNYVDVPFIGVDVSCGALLDGVSPSLEELVEISSHSKTITQEEVVEILKNSNTDVVISYLPVGSEKAAEFYAEAALKAGCGFINCMPAKIATDEKFQRLFEEKGLPLLGDDIKSQIGSTAIHRSLITLLQNKGVKIQRTYQLNIGGNTDFKNMRDPDRSKGKKFTKETSLKHLFNENTELGVGPSDYVPFLHDHKVGYIFIEGTGLLGMPFSIEMKLKVEDSPNSAGVAINAIRAAKTAMDRGQKGIVTDACPYLFKNPPVAMEEEQTFAKFHAFAEFTSTDTQRSEDAKHTYKQTA
jgi:myo-inositol-1-phosphate synthase